MIPRSDSSLAKGVPPVELWRNVSSKRMTPLIAFDTSGGKEQFPVSPVIFFSRFELDRIETFLDGGIAFIRCKNSLLFCHNGSGH
jgi:hypothetical protein